MITINENSVLSVEEIENFNSKLKRKYGFTKEHSLNIIKTIPLYSWSSNTGVTDKDIATYITFWFEQRPFERGAMQFRVYVSSRNTAVVTHNFINFLFPIIKDAMLSNNLKYNREKTNFTIVSKGINDQSGLMKIENIIDNVDKLFKTDLIKKFRKTVKVKRL